MVYYKCREIENNVDLAIGKGIFFANTLNIKQIYQFDK